MKRSLILSIFRNLNGHELLTDWGHDPSWGELPLISRDMTVRIAMERTRDMGSFIFDL